MALFSKMIKCKKCGANYKTRKDRKHRVYVCSRYDNYSKCERTPVKEDFLKELIEGRFEREMSDDEIREVVDHIEVEGKLLLEIHLKKHKSIQFKENFIRF